MPELKYTLNLKESMMPSKRTKYVGRKSTVQRINVGSFFKPKYMFRRYNITQEQLDILKELNDAGISVERPISFKLGKNKDMLFLSKGRRISLLAYDLKSADVLLDYYTVAVDILGEMHLRNISHNHPHLGNIVRGEQDKVSIIDFKHAKRNVINWNSGQSVFDAFKLDYANIRKTMFEMGLGRSMALELIKRLISRYNMPKHAKEELLGLIYTKLLP